MPASVPRHRSTIRASEIATYLFCRRAWWYLRAGAAPEASPAIEAGLAWHRAHGRRVLTAAILRGAGWALLLTALAGAAAVIADAI